MPELTLVLTFLIVSVLLTFGLGHYMAKVFDGQFCILSPVERGLLRLTGLRHVDESTWQEYLKQFLLLNGLCGLLGFGFLVLQGILPLNPLHLTGMEAWQAFNTVCSFITNTNWQSYSGEVSLSNLSQMWVIIFLQVVGAVSGVSVGVAFLRGLTNKGLGNFYQDFVRALLYVFLPVMLVGSLFFISQGVPQTLTQQVTAHTVEGGMQKVALGPVAALLTIKQFGTNGGGFFNANSAHPFENPNELTNFIEMMLELAIPMGLVCLFGLWLNDKKQGWMIWGSMMALFWVAFGTALYCEHAGNAVLTHLHLQPLANLEGKEMRFGLAPSILFAIATTATSTGAVNTMHDSLTPMGGLVPLANMMLNVIYGGVGVGLMGYLLYGIIAVFLTGLMVGRTPEIFGKKLEKPEIILASIAILLHPALILIPSAIAAVFSFGTSSLNNLGPHGFSEILYAYTSAAANNGSAFAGLNANTPWYNISIGIVIMLGRYISMIALLAIAGSLLSKPRVEPGPGTLRTNTVLFSVVWLGIILVVGALTFVPALMLGPVAEYLAMHSGKLF